MSRPVRSAPPGRPLLPPLKVAWALLGAAPLAVGAIAHADAIVPPPRSTQPHDLPEPSKRHPPLKGKMVRVDPVTPEDVDALPSEEKPGDPKLPCPIEQGAKHHPAGKSGPVKHPMPPGRMPPPRALDGFTRRDGLPLVLHPHEPWEPCETIDSPSRTA